VKAQGDGTAISGAPTRAPAADAQHAVLGLLLGLLGVLAFSLTLPMTRAAVAQLDPWFVAFGRMAGAGVLAAVWLLIARAPRPVRADLWMLACSAIGVVIGFPLLTSLAMKTMPANHGAIINGALPFATAVLAWAIFGERQSRRFWIAAAVGSAIVIAFALRDGLATAGAQGGALAMGGAVLIAAVGYVTGGRVAARIGGVGAILWALVIALPLTLPVALVLIWVETPSADGAAWAAFAYVTLISQLFGFFAWYNGLALGGIARVSQVQLLQVFFTIAVSGLAFGETVHPATWLAAAAVVATIAIGRTSARTT
jgi:drug/metabolite transporter (DMT)-like permease